MRLNPQIIVKDGKATIVGHGHLKAEMVARLVVDGNQSVAETMEQYHLSPAEVHAALAYYYDNQAELDAAHALKLAEIEANSLKSSEHLAQLQARRLPLLRNEPL